MMDGFDPQFETPEDYILGITKEIWEDRGIATLHRYYAPDIVVRSPSGVVVGNQGVIAATMATLAEFPDRTLLGEDVIWSQDPDGGFLSSHRILSTATHTGSGAYGEPTGKTLRYRIIADCAARTNQIYDEWLIRDQGAIVRQLDIDPKTYAGTQIEAEGGPDTALAPLSPSTDQQGPYAGTGNDDEPGVIYAELLESLMAADFTAIDRGYDRAVQCELPGGVTSHGRQAIDTFWMGVRSAVPDADFVIHHRIGRTDAGQAPRAALRWSLTGIHSGWGAFGQPTGAQIHIMGLSHAEFGPRGLRREFVLFDEAAVWKQILLHTG